MEESDPTNKVLCTKPGGSGDRRRGRPKLRKCDESEKDVSSVGAETGELLHSRRRSSHIQGGSANGRRKLLLVRDQIQTHFVVFNDSCEIENFNVVNMKVTEFWDVMPFSLADSSVSDETARGNQTSSF
jgi:hypothetical protein